MQANPIGTVTSGTAARRMGVDALAEALRDAHQYTASILAAIGECRSTTATGWQVPRLATINPPLWEYGHLAWFAEWWVLRDPRPIDDAADAPWHAVHPSILSDADRWFDSARVAHDTRWELDLPPPAAIEDYVREIGERVRDRLGREGSMANDALYPYRLALFHEDMHGEALTCLCQALDYAAPAGVSAQLRATDRRPVSIAIDAGRFVRGVTAGDGFSFDNERAASPVTLAPFTIDRDCLSNAAFQAFVDDGGYRDARLWPGAAARWTATLALDHPVRWRRSGDGGWQQRWFGAWQALPPAAPVCHVNAFEAEAYCLWAGRRLPRECEWECAAVDRLDDGSRHGADDEADDKRDDGGHDSAHDGEDERDRFRWGRAVWEWTADAFEPYPGFRPDRYREYSAPWFGTHRSVRGASFATRARMRHPRYRNFYMPERSDLFVGFRTCAR